MGLRGRNSFQKVDIRSGKKGHTTQIVQNELNSGVNGDYANDMPKLRSVLHFYRRKMKVFWKQDVNTCVCKGNWSRCSDVVEEKPQEMKHAVEGRRTRT